MITFIITKKVKEAKIKTRNENRKIHLFLCFAKYLLYNKGKRNERIEVWGLPTKMVLVMRKDLGMTKGKYVAKGCDACLGLTLDIQKGTNIQHQELLKQWLEHSFVKVCVYVKSVEELHEIYNAAQEKNLAVKLVTDNGQTMFHGVLTETCLAILGEVEEVDSVTGHLPLL